MAHLLALVRVTTNAAITFFAVRDVIVPLVARQLAKRNARKNDAKDDLRVLNSHAVISTPLLEYPEAIGLEARKGLEPVAEGSKARLLRNNHKRFCAKWARAAKARFEFARICEDSAINRAALHRWLLSQWKDLKNGSGKTMPLHVLDLFMTDTIDMCFLPTDTFAQSESKRAVRKRARMEYYNERKFVEGWK